MPNTIISQTHQEGFIRLTLALPFLEYLKAPDIDTLPALQELGVSESLMRDANVYLHTELVALLCICQVKQCTPINQDEPNQVPQWHCELEFSQILEDDIEQLVKTSLAVQQKMLKKRKQNIDKQRR